MGQDGGGFVVDESTATVDDSPQQPNPDATTGDRLSQYNSCPATDAVQFTVCQQQCVVTRKTDDFRFDTATVLSFQSSHSTDGSGKTGCSDRQTNQARDTTTQSDR